jgi:hypothetical protein
LRLILHFNDDIGFAHLDFFADFLDEEVGSGAIGDANPSCALGATLIDETNKNPHIN